jgi:hypothetical protein
MRHVRKDLVGGDADPTKTREVSILGKSSLLFSPSDKVMSGIEVEAALGGTLHNRQGADGVLRPMLVNEKGEVYVAIDIGVMNEECLFTGEKRGHLSKSSTGVEQGRFVGDEDLNSEVGLRLDELTDLFRVVMGINDYCGYTNLLKSVHHAFKHGLATDFHQTFRCRAREFFES